MATCRLRAAVPQSACAITEGAITRFTPFLILMLETAAPSGIETVNFAP